MNASFLDSKLIKCKKSYKNIKSHIYIYKKKCMVIRCNYCNKQYASYSSRCNHIKKYHNDEYIKSPQISSFFTHNSSKMSNINLDKTNKLCCQYCNKESKI